jgi:hypothetical protein
MPKTIAIAVFCPLRGNTSECAHKNSIISQAEIVIYGNGNYVMTVPLVVNDWHVSDDFSRTRNSLAEIAAEKALHAVCTAQVFRNPYSGHYLYLFSSHYLSLGYLVIVYDRYKCCVLCGRWM